MNVHMFNSPIGLIAFTPDQLQRIRSIRNDIPEPPVVPDGIPDFTDEEVQMIMEDEGNPERALRHRRYH